MKLMSNDEVDMLKLHNDEFNKQESLSENERTGIQKRTFIDTAFAKYVLSENLDFELAFWYYVVNDEVPSTSSDIVEQVEVIQEVVLPGTSNCMTKHQTKNKETKHNFLQKSL